MKTIKLTVFIGIVSFMAAALFSGCARNEEPKAMTPTAVVSSLAADKDLYVTDVEAKITDYQTKIDELKTKAAAMNGSARDELSKKIELLTVENDEVKARLEVVKSASVNNWDDARLDTDAAVDELSSLYRDAAALVQ